MSNIDIARVDLNLLKALKALLDEKHVGRAAESMHVSQSAMSHTLSRLRDTFNDPLFIRTSKGIEPTSRAIEISDSLGFILSEISNLMLPKQVDPGAIKTRFRIQTHDYIATEILPKRLASIQRQAPNIVFELLTYNAHSYEQLEKGEVDLIIGAGHAANPKYMQRKILIDELVCLMSAEHPAKNSWNVDSLFRYPHVRLSLLPEKNDPVHMYAKRHGIKRNMSILTDSLHMQPAMVENTDAIAFVPKTLANASCKALNLIVKDAPFEMKDIAIKEIWHPRHQSDLVHSWIRSEMHKSIE